MSKIKSSEFEILKNKMTDFLKARDWNDYHNPKNIAMSIAIEAAELMELFQWNAPTKDEVKQNAELLANVKDELADVMIYAISMALQLDINLFECIEAKMTLNNKRFPPKTSL